MLRINWQVHLLISLINKSLMFIVNNKKIIIMTLTEAQLRRIFTLYAEPAQQLAIHNSQYTRISTTSNNRIIKQDKWDSLIKEIVRLSKPSGVER